MEVVTYKKHKIYFETIPKGTLVFRAVANREDDLSGVSIGDKKCIPPTYNVFFYLNPFVTESQAKWYEQIKNMEVYELTKNVKVMLLLKPSKNTRGDPRSTRRKKPFLIKCSDAPKSCLEGKEYDPCFSEDFIQKFPNVVGYIGIGKTDAEILLDSMNTTLKNVVDYIQISEDDRNIKGSPELVLYPLQKRKLNDIEITDPEEWKKHNKFNYKHMKTVPHKQKDLIDFIEKYTTRDQTTGYYSYKNS
jgi:hypothetical protein